jgi:DNA-binding transcriptional ArsR family regulator
MPTSSEQLEDALLELAWSQWTELGVRGVVARRSASSIDPEALLVLTAGLAERDPRLRDESLDWCVKHHRYLSRSRLRNVLRRLSASHRTAYDRYAATLSAAGVRGWPAEAESWPFEASSKSTLADLSRPALARIRLRAIFGVSARAEILHVLAWQSSGWTSSAELAELAGYTKRNVDEALDNLVRGGLVEVHLVGNRRMVRLADRTSFEALVGQPPDATPHWVTILTVMADLSALFQASDVADPRVQDVEASRVIAELSNRTGMTALPPLPAAGPSAWDRLLRWVLLLAADPTGTEG